MSRPSSAFPSATGSCTCSPSATVRSPRSRPRSSRSSHPSCPGTATPSSRRRTQGCTNPATTTPRSPASGSAASSCGSISAQATSAGCAPSTSSRPSASPSPSPLPRPLHSLLPKRLYPKTNHSSRALRKESPPRNLSLLQHEHPRCPEPAQLAPQLWRMHAEARALREPRELAEPVVVHPRKLLFARVPVLLGPPPQPHVRVPRASGQEVHAPQMVVRVPRRPPVHHREHRPPSGREHAKELAQIELRLLHML